ncbi:MAG TPA: hypothetical protein VNU64_12015 [Burkholderiales bacterium]|nr:hypothetical protein [Burkholderiales bacterium]
MTKMVAHHVPTDPALLAAVGEVAIRHEHLNHILRMTIKSLANVPVEVAQAATKYDGSRQLRDRARKLARKMLVEGPPLMQLQAILAHCERLSELRNELVHGLWAEDHPNAEGTAHVRNAFGQSRPIPTLEELNSLARQLEALSSSLNHARLYGWLKDAIEDRARSLGK